MDLLLLGNYYIEYGQRVQCATLVIYNESFPSVMVNVS
jgi:hypothetical protein